MALFFAQRAASRQALRPMWPALALVSSWAEAQNSLSWSFDATAAKAPAPITQRAPALTTA